MSIYEKRLIHFDYYLRGLGKYMSDEQHLSREARHDFSAATRELIAKRSGYLCAYPGCKKMTVAGSNDRISGVTVTGVAAHITAASKNGPRYDANMSQAERVSESNGIWTCQNHGKFIDDNPSKCTVEELRRWKLQHEKWVFDRVESGTELFNQGVFRVSFGHIGVFQDEYKIPFARHNLLVGSNESGKTSICQIISAFSDGLHWNKFNERFGFEKRAAEQSFIEIRYYNNHIRTCIKLSPQFNFRGKRKVKNISQRVHIEVNGSPSVDWPRPLYRVLNLENQLYRMHYRDPKNTLIKAVRYLSYVFNTNDNLIWDSLREELFSTSTFGYKIDRVGHRKLNVLVPDGRDFYLPHGALSATELQETYLDICLKMISCTPNHENWIIIFDSNFFAQMDSKRKALLFSKFIDIGETNIQTLFCLHSIEDAEALKFIHSDKWVNAINFGKLTLHSFL